MYRTKRLLVAMVSFSMILSFASSAAGEEEETLMDWVERIHITGTVETDFSLTDKSDISDKDSASTSDILISTVEIGAEVEFTDYLSGNLLLLKEDIGTPDETDLEVDEAMVSIRKEGFPVYLATGKRAQPFGLFENHLLTDPMTQDAYETNRPGVTVGVMGPMGLDVSATYYKGEEMMAHLFESGLFDDGAVERVDDPADPGAYETEAVNSYIISASVTPVEELVTVFAGYISEPGRGGERNTTGNAGLSLGISNLRVEAEYMTALNREKYDVGGTLEEFEESVLSVSAAYEFVLREREALGGALFAQRKAHVVSEPLELALRYEVFDDDDMFEKAQAWSVDSRMSAGARYSFYNDPEAGLAAYVGVEYRHTEYNLHQSLEATYADSNDEFLVRLGVSF